jgi:hypothetical protein
MPSKPFLTIGMAHFADYHGVYFTIQALRLNNPHLMPMIEFIVIDNSPTLPEAGAIKDLINNINAGKDGASAKYIPMSGPVGTSPSRNAIFEHASGDFVLAMDCHVLLWPGALESIIAHYQANPLDNDLHGGPMFYDSLASFSTHFNNMWRAEMLGVWGVAWQCKCRQFNFTMMDEGGLAVPVTLDMEHVPLKSCPKCEKIYEPRGWSAHEIAFEQDGFKRLGPSDADEPFEIPGQGLGMFSCRRAAWLGFHPSARGFGGEELYIHSKFRQVGYKALCHPAWKWLHRFGRPDGVKYPLTRWFKVRNYVLEFNELGWDLAPIYNHFVATGLMGESGWQNLIANPIELEVEPANSGCSTCPGSTNSVALPEFGSVQDLFTAVQAKPRDLDQHMPILREYASKVKHATELTARRESTIALLTGRPETVISYSSEVDGHVTKAAVLVADSTRYDRRPLNPAAIVMDMQPTELVFIDTKHTYEHVLTELRTYSHAASRFMVLHDTSHYGAVGDDGGKGIIFAIADFLANNPKWFVIYQVKEQYGLTILACNESDRPEGPGTELKLLLKDLGVNPGPACECNERMTAMNIWGIAGCIENRAVIISWLKDGQVKWGWKDKLVAAASAVASGLAFKLNIMDPMPGIVDECINRAKAKWVAQSMLSEIAEETKGGDE